MKKKYAFLLMGENYHTKNDIAIFENENNVAYIVTVNNFEDACERIIKLKDEDIGAIELCGAFTKNMADKIIEITNNKVAVGYVIHNKEQDDLFNNFFHK